MKRYFKIFISLLLVFAMLIALIVPTCAEGATTDLSIFVASDIHYRPQSSLPPIAEVNNLTGETLYSHANTKSMLTYESDGIIDEFLARFEASPAKYLLIPGDLSEDGFWDEHIGIAEKLREFKERTGKKIFIIPGNHDVRTSDSQDRLNLSDFLDIYADIGFDDALEKHEESASYTADLDENYRLIAIDACIYREDGSRISPGLLKWIEKQVLAASQDGKMLIGMVHHSVLEHFGIENIGGNLLCLENYKELATQFADWGIKYFFTGHEHANDISAAVSEKGNKIYDIETGSLITYPNAYREVSFSDMAVKIETKYIDKINTGLLPDGYTGEQLELLENDFPTYSYEYFKAGIKSYAYEIPELTEKLARKFKIENGTAMYNALADAMDMISTALNLPLYDNEGTPEVDSIEEIAQKQGIKIDKSDYKNILDVAATIYAAHYAGDEHLEYNSPEVRILGCGLNAVLLYTSLNIPITIANSLFASIGLPTMGFSIIDNINTTEREPYIKSAVKIVMKEMIEPLSDGIINDISVPGDLNESLEPYGSSHSLEGQTIAISDFKYFLNIILKILTAILKSTANLFFY